MNIVQAKKIPLTKILLKLGYSPLREEKGGNEKVYLSPFRKETKPSFFVNEEKNIWNDFGGNGGNVLDFVMCYTNTDLSGALEYLEQMDLGSFMKSDFKAIRETKKPNAIKYRLNEESFVLDGVMPLKSIILEDYLKERAIDINIARKYLQVIQFYSARNQAKKYFGLGIKNLSEGYEVRNRVMKSVIGKKDVSFFSGKEYLKPKKRHATIFESFIDFLSFLTEQRKEELESDVIILNSTKMIHRAKQIIRDKKYSKIYTCFDNDMAGDDAALILSGLERESNLKIISCNHLYFPFKDYNDYLVATKPKK